jgi:protein ImuB
MSVNKRAFKSADAPFLRAVAHSYCKPALPNSKSFWYALHFPALRKSAHTAQIEELAAICLRANDQIYVPGNDTLALNIRSSLRLFGGPKGLSRALRPALQDKLRQLDLPMVYSESASPSAAASVLLSRVGHNVLIPGVEGLRSGLGHIATEHLALDQKIKKRMHACGLHYLRDLWRMPSAALRLRLGRELSEYLLQLLGEHRTYMPRWHEQLIFNETMTPDASAETPADILFLAEHLLDQLESFLRKHHRATDQLRLELTDSKYQSHTIELFTRSPVRIKPVWLLLLELKLQKSLIKSPVISLSLICRNFQNFCPTGAYPGQIRLQHAVSDKTNPGLLELLSSRLGKDAIFTLHHQEDYDPLAAGNYLQLGDLQTTTRFFNTPRSKGFLTAGRQPSLLLPAPIPLTTRYQKPVYFSPLTLIQGPQRIETRWWTGQDIQRDYYIARNLQGMSLWIFRDLKLSRESATAHSCWFLQGLFA